MKLPLAPVLPCRFFGCTLTLGSVQSGGDGIWGLSLPGKESHPSPEKISHTIACIQAVHAAGEQEADPFLSPVAQVFDEAFLSRWGPVGLPLVLESRGDGIG